MVCVQCGGKTQVINSRPQKRINQVWRRRECYDCGSIFTSTEAADYSASWRVVGSSGKLTPFSRDKLFLSLHKSCSHRKTALQDASGLADTIIGKLLPQVTNGTLTSKIITRTALVALTRFDKAASVHYQAFHQT